MSKSKPRIAFCFSGQARTLDQTYLFFQKNLFDAAKEQGFDYDVFCAVEDDEDVDKVNLLNPTKVEKIKSSEVEKIIEEKWGENRVDKIFSKYSFLCLGLDYKKYYNRLLMQLYKVQESVKLTIQDNVKYNIIIRLRFDVFLFNKINFQNIDKQLKKGGVIMQKQKHFIKQKFISDRLLIINDFFFFGGQTTMQNLGIIFDDFQELLIGYECSYKSKKFFYGLSELISNINVKLFHHRIIPTVPIRYFETYFHKVLCAEILYHDFFERKGINIILEDFSRILLRNKTSDSALNIVNKNKFEI